MDKEITLGERIYKYRTARGLSQLELSELLDVSRQSISKWETDVATPELSKLIKMAEVFEISLDALILGKKDVAKNEVSAINEPAPATVAPVAEIRERSRLKAGFGFCFLGAGILLSFLILLLAGDFLAALILFVPFGVSAFFCLNQFRYAALWCVESWYCWIVAYFYYATGSHWNGWLTRLFHIATLGMDIQTIISLGFFLLLVVFISLTVFVYRKKCFKFSTKKNTILACITVLTFPAKKLALWLSYTFWFQIIGNGDKIDYYTVIYQNYRALILTIDFLIDLAFTITFTACLVPTYYWVRELLKNRKVNTGNN